MKKGTQHGEHTSAAFRHGSVIVADVAYRGEDACTALTAMKEMLETPRTQPPSIGCKAAILSMASLKLEKHMNDVFGVVNESRTLLMQLDEDFDPVELYRFAMENWPNVNEPSRLLAKWRRRGNSMRVALLQFADWNPEGKLLGSDQSPESDAYVQDQAGDWEVYGFTPETAKRWREAGCWNAEKASELRDAGIDPALVDWDDDGHFGCRDTVGRQHADGVLTLDEVRSLVE